ncbi:hypothetical protein CXF78_13820 [Shewanella sp. 11B5]|uniref:arginase family protein n=1 Tax=Shewanella sp. 11B5 TaxID=2058298 RepID=UPI000C7E7A82|nr:arginase family protein [Shewanella sp. 11B5]MBB1381382.1 arginase family protein [Shewanella sp. SR41-2]PKH99446.1 hypothetical protein CXF78_13820 [Shewanella sp. 11B5]|tara:strand:+ start:13396 stop:13596 length:201 start_codon:yes stop_codon:yes gene_type:complete
MLICGGLSSNKMMMIIRGLLGINVVCMDVVEVAPSHNSLYITALAEVALYLEMLHVWTEGKGLIKK